MILNNDYTKPYKVGGVIENFPTTSHLQYDFLITLTETIGECIDTFSDTLHVAELPGVELFPYADTTLCPDAA